VQVALAVKAKQNERAVRLPRPEVVMPQWNDIRQPASEVLKMMFESRELKGLKPGNLSVFRRCLRHAFILGAL